MKLRIFVVYDRAAEVFGNPWMSPSRGGAIRSFGDTINRVTDKDVMSMHPEHFDLYELGTWDDTTGLYETGAPEKIAMGSDMKVAKSESRAVQ